LLFEEIPKNGKVMEFVIDSLIL